MKPHQNAEHWSYLARVAAISAGGRYTAARIGERLNVRVPDSVSEPLAAIRIADATAMIKRFDESQELVGELLAKLADACTAAATVEREAIEQLDRDSETIAQLRSDHFDQAQELKKLRAEIAEKEALMAACEPDITRAVEKFSTLTDALVAAKSATPGDAPPGDPGVRYAFHFALGQTTEREGGLLWCERVTYGAIARFAEKLLESIAEPKPDGGE